MKCAYIVCLCVCKIGTKAQHQQQWQQQQKNVCVCIRFTSIIKLLDQKGKYTILLLLFVWSRVFMCIVYIMCVRV